MSSYLNISRSNYFASLLFIIVIAGSIFFYHRVQAVDTTYTVCASGCDFTSLTSALANPGLGTLGNDTVQITADYVYVDAGSLILSVPDNVTVECLVGAPPFGNSGGAAQINLGSNVTIQDCTFENIDFSATNKTNVNLINDTFSDVTSGDVSFIETNGFKISDNTEIQRIDIRNSDNGIIDNNSFECRFYDNCISTTVSGGSYSISADIPSNIDITNNTITNFRTGTLGDFISLDAGENINFTGNTIKSDVELDDNFVPMLTMQNAEAYIAGNYFLFPEKVPAATNDTWGVNIRVNVANATVVAEHNTFILNGTGSILGGSSCFGVFDDNNPAFTPTISLTADYNLCYNPSVDAGGTGVQLNYDSSSINMIFDNSYNGFYNLSDLINNTNPTPPLLFTSLDGTTTTADPVLRTENVDTLDDYDPVSMSRYLDVNGINDIGALSAVRLVDYLIDDDCVVDYTSCVSNDSDILNTVIKSGDTIEIASGIYPPMTLDGPLNSITIEGAGSSTIFDASGVGSTLTLIDIDDSNINDIKLQSSTAPTITTYEITRARYTDSITTYDQFVNLDPEIPNGVFIIKGPPIANECENDIIDSDGADVTAAVGTATDNWNLVLMDYLGNKLTGFAPNNFISSALDFEGCADPGDITVEYFINDIFTVSGGIFTYNQAVADLVGVSVKLGDTDPPALTRIITQPSEGGILIENSDDNNFENIIFENNTLDITTDTTGDNSFINPVFDLSKIEINNTGDLNIYYTINALIIKAGNLNPISGATVSIKNAQNNTVATLTTADDGLTPFSNPLLATVLSQGGPFTVTAGGLNPFSFTASASRFSSKTTTSDIISPEQQFNFNLDSTSGGGSSGGYVMPVIIPVSPTPAPVLPLVPVLPILDSCVSDVVFTRLLAFGSRGEDVSSLQKILEQLGFYKARIDGIYGPITKQAVIYFQIANNLVPYPGWVGPGTRQALNAQSGCMSAVSNLNLEISLFINNLKSGDRNSDVLKLQQFLNTHGFPLSNNGLGSPGQETDFYGILTRQAVQKLQLKYGIIKNTAIYGYGIFGTRTRAVVNKLISSQ